MPTLVATRAGSTTSTFVEPVENPDARAVMVVEPTTADAEANMAEVYDSPALIIMVSSKVPKAEFEENKETSRSDGAIAGTPDGSCS